MLSTVRLPQAHRVTKRLSGGRVAIYWYRYRGGPQLTKFEGEHLAAAVAAERVGATALASAYAASNNRLPQQVMSVRDLIMRYRAAPDGLLRLRDSTRAQWSRWLDEIDLRFGRIPLKALKAKGVRAEFIAWRNSRATKARTADYGIQVLKRLLAFGLENELTDANPAVGIQGIYRSSRADKIVEPETLAAILNRVTPEAARLFRLAAATGMRRGDLIKLRWADLSEKSIEFATEKSNGSQRPIVPILPEARAVIDELLIERNAMIAAGKIPSSYLLTTKLGTPWKKDSATQAFWRAARALQIDRNLHDLRGTAVTRFILAGLSDEQVAEIVGWEPTRVRQVRRRYVDREAIARGVIAQLEKAERAS